MPNVIAFPRAWKSVYNSLNEIRKTFITDDNEFGKHQFDEIIHKLNGIPLILDMFLDAVEEKKKEITEEEKQKLKQYRENYEKIYARGKHYPFFLLKANLNNHTRK